MIKYLALENNDKVRRSKEFLINLTAAVALLSQLVEASRRKMDFKNS